jgi:hypothetical protein
VREQLASCGRARPSEVSHRVAMARGAVVDFDAFMAG